MCTRLFWEFHFRLKMLKNCGAPSNFGRWGQQNAHETVARARFPLENHFNHHVNHISVHHSIMQVVGKCERSGTHELRLENTLGAKPCVFSGKLAAFAMWGESLRTAQGMHGFDTTSSVFPFIPLHHSCIHSVLYAFLSFHWFIPAFSRSCVHSFVRSFSHSFIPSSIPSFIFSCIHSFMHLSVYAHVYIQIYSNPEQDRKIQSYILKWWYQNTFVLLAVTMLHVYMHINKTNVYKNMYIYICIYMWIYVYVYIYVCVCVCIYIYLYVYMCVCVIYMLVW